MFEDMLLKWGFSRNDMFQNPAGYLIGLRSLNKQRGLDNILLWYVEARSMFARERHTFGHELHIQEGDGLAQIGDDLRPYKKGDIIRVPAGVWHCLARVDAQTVVRQEHPSYLQSPARSQ